MFPSETRGAHATVAINQVFTSSPILALILAVVYIDITVLSRPAKHTVTEVTTNQVTARVGIGTWFAFTFVGINEARLP